MDFGENFVPIAQADLDVDIAYEREQQEAMVRVGDGHFFNDQWLRKEGELDNYQKLVDKRPVVLHTAMRYDDAEKPAMGGLSFVHDRHPFLGFLHLLHHAERGSSVYMSIPYLTDFYALNQICHYAQEDHGNLQIYIIIGPKHFNLETIERFINNNEAVRAAIQKLHIKRFRRDDGSRSEKYFHTKAVVSSAGAMVGSYNYTVAARLRHYEHSSLLAPDDADCEEIRNELKYAWDMIKSSEVKFPKKVTEASKRSSAGEIYNPYKKSKP